MAKTSQVHRDLHRKKLIAKHAVKRAELRGKLQDPEVPVDEKFAVQAAFAKLPRNSCPTRKNNRCALTGRSQVQNPTSGLWVKRDTSSGRFVSAKKSGGSFKGVRRES